MEEITYRKFYEIFKNNKDSLRWLDTYLSTVCFTEDEHLVVILSGPILPLRASGETIDVPIYTDIGIVSSLAVTVEFDPIDNTVSIEAGLDSSEDKIWTSEKISMDSVMNTLIIDIQSGLLKGIECDIKIPLMEFYNCLLKW